MDSGFIRVKKLIQKTFCRYQTLGTFIPAPRRMNPPVSNTSWCWTMCLQPVGGAGIFLHRLSLFEVESGDIISESHAHVNLYSPVWWNRSGWMSTCRQVSQPCVTSQRGLDSQLTHRTFKALTCTSEGRPRQAESCSEPRCWSAEEQLSALITLTASSTFKF